jgi:hypothetical protein
MYDKVTEVPMSKELLMSVRQANSMTIDTEKED